MQTDLANYVGTLIGTPWRNRTRDCWWLVRRVYQDRLGITLRLIDVDANDLRAVTRAFKDPDNLRPWKEIQNPEPFAMAFFAAHKRASHVALWLNLNGGGYLHTYQGAGVVFTRPEDMDTNGWREPVWYRHRDVARIDACRRLLRRD